METNYDVMIQADVDELIASLACKECTENLDRLRTAFEFAREAHSPQRRKSGEPYIIHPVSVAKIVLDYGMDSAVMLLLPIASAVVLQLALMPETAAVHKVLVPL